MKTIGDKLDAFTITGVKPGFNHHEENGVSAFETITEKSFPGKWKVIYFWPKDFTFVCPTEIVGFDKIARQFEERDTVLLGGSTDNEFSKLGWRRDHKDLNKLGHWSFGDSKGSLVDMLGVRDRNTLAAVVADPARTPSAVARDAARHPVEALTFFGLEPAMTVIEPGPARATGPKFWARTSPVAVS